MLELKLLKRKKLLTMLLLGDIIIAYLKNALMELFFIFVCLRESASGASRYIGIKSSLIPEQSC